MTHIIHMLTCCMWQLDFEALIPAFEWIGQTNKKVRKFQLVHTFLLWRVNFRIQMHGKITVITFSLCD